MKKSFLIPVRKFYLSIPLMLVIILWGAGSYASQIDYELPEIQAQSFKSYPLEVSDLLYDFDLLVRNDIQFEWIFESLSEEAIRTNTLFAYYLNLMEAPSATRKIKPPFWEDRLVEHMLDTEIILKSDIHIEEGISSPGESNALEAVVLIVLSVLLLSAIVFRLINLKIGLFFIFLWIFVWNYVVTFIVGLLPEKAISIIEKIIRLI